MGNAEALWIVLPPLGFKTQLQPLLFICVELSCFPLIYPACEHSSQEQPQIYYDNLTSYGKLMSDVTLCSAPCHIGWMTFQDVALEIFLSV